MGYYPKHLKQRHYRQRLKLVALAALAGCRYELRLNGRTAKRWRAQCSCGSRIVYEDKAYVAKTYLECAGI